jgi:hypothetical protein
MSQEVDRLVEEVVSRIAPRLGADGSRGTLLVVLCGASAGFSEAAAQLRALVLDGFRLELAFSGAAEELHGMVFRKQLAGFPHVSLLDSSEWLKALGRSKGVLIPLLTVNTLSKIALLLADNLVTNIILHALLMGKNVVAARNGADPAESSRADLGFNRGAPALGKALMERFRVVSTYGCRFADVRQLRETLNALLDCRRDELRDEERAPWRAGTSVVPVKKVVTAETVLRAARMGQDTVACSGSTVITPLARELARQYGICLEDERFFVGGFSGASRRRDE